MKSRPKSLSLVIIASLKDPALFLRDYEQLFVEKTSLSAVELNCGELELELADIEKLEKCIEQKAMPISPGGFFYGHQFQDEAEDEYRDQDIMFCEWSRREIAEGNTVIYSCWW